ncbi:MAG TPA: TIGR00296 family protein [Thermoplasmata archaeon]|nr:TIGR00296 family protein [Thermoplasmata archaeon]
MYSDAEGELAVRMAREAIEAATRSHPFAPMRVPASFERESGVFVTINTFPNEELRGCIGYPQPYFPLAKAIVRAAEGATEDPRFPKLAEGELDRVVVEVSILTPPELIEVNKPKELIAKVHVGTDGLIIAQGQERGLLLPQVAIDYRWTAEEFLTQTCLKAGLMPDAWFEPDTRVYKFQSEVWTEAEPRGPVVRRVLKKHARA